jgi:diketogulonate reductase-like aldo/keto reductase
MRRRPLGTTEALVPVVGQGTWQMERDPKPAVIAALRRGLELGLTHLDTAEMYGDGEVERIVGEAIRGRREGVYLVSKVLPHNASRRGTVAACERSLKRLGTDYLDLYLLHWPGEHPLTETIAAFDELVRQKKIRAWGVSNFDEHELEQALAIGVERRAACNQVLYHLKQRTIEHRVLPLCEAENVALVAYSPFGQGDFPDQRSRGGRVLAEIAEARAATPRQVALAFLLQSDAVFVIPKASRVEHVEENAGAGELLLSQDEIAQIDQAVPRGRPRRGVPML